MTNPKLVCYLLFVIWYFTKVVGLDGFEPSASRLSGVRSDQAELQARPNR